MLRIIGLLVFFAAIVISPTRGDELADALYSYDHGAGPRAVALLLPLAEAGSVRAQEALLHIYAYGEGVPVDMVRCRQWSERAAAAGSAIGENSLAVSYARGEGGLAKNDPLAIAWFEKAAADGSTKAMVSLARRYLYGITVKQDVPRGLGYLKQAADGGLDRAQYAFADFTYFGNFGLKPDAATTSHYLQLSASQGYSHAAAVLGQLALDQWRPDRARAIKWFTIAASGGCPIIENLRALVSISAPAEVIQGIADAAAWLKAATPRDTHLVAEDPTNGCRDISFSPSYSI